MHCTWLHLSHSRSRPPTAIHIDIPPSPFICRRSPIARLPSRPRPSPSGTLSQGAWNMVFRSSHRDRNKDRFHYRSFTLSIPHWKHRRAPRLLEGRIDCQPSNNDCQTNSPLIGAVDVAHYGDVGRSQGIHGRIYALLGSIQNRQKRVHRSAIHALPKIHPTRQLISSLGRTLCMYNRTTRRYVRLVSNLTCIFDRCEIHSKALWHLPLRLQLAQDHPMGWTNLAAEDFGLGPMPSKKHPKLKSEAVLDVHSATSKIGSGLLDGSIRKRKGSLVVQDRQWRDVAKTAPPTDVQNYVTKIRTKDRLCHSKTTTGPGKSLHELASSRTECWACRRKLPFESGYKHRQCRAVRDDLGKSEGVRSRGRRPI